MSLSVNLHQASHAVAERSGQVAWLTIKSKESGSIGVFMPFDVAEAMAKVFNDAMIPVPAVDPA